MVEVYRNVDEHWDLYQLAEKLVDIEDSHQQWRFRHMKTVERIIGFKKGTGGSAGVNYLKSVLDHRFFRNYGVCGQIYKQKLRRLDGGVLFNFYIFLPLIVRLLSEAVNFQSFLFQLIKARYYFSSRQWYLLLLVNNRVLLATLDNCWITAFHLKW